MNQRALIPLLLALYLAAPVVEGASLAATVTGGNGRPLANAVVVAVPEGGAPPRTGAPAVEVVDQIRKEFTPYVKPIRVGSLVEFPNRDNVQHHVYSFSTAKPFELPLYKGKPAQALLFDKPGVVRLGCNIHDWMIGYIYVADSPWYGKTGDDGRVRLDGLHPGRYRVRAWHPWMDGPEESTVIEVDLREGPVRPVAWVLKIKPELSPRRAPVPGDAGYR